MCRFKINWQVSFSFSPVVWIWLQFSSNLASVNHPCSLRWLLVQARLCWHTPFTSCLPRYESASLWFPCPLLSGTAGRLVSSNLLLQSHDNFLLFLTIICYMFNIHVVLQILLWIHVNADLLLHSSGLFFQVDVAVKSAVLIFPFIESSWNRVWFPLPVLT